jgi:hypothetical protein
MTDKPISRKANIVVQDLETEVLIYDLTTNKAFCLNQTAGLVYQLCDGRRTVAEISDLMSKELKTLVSEDFVWLALDGLKKDGLLENTDELANHFGGLTRREIVKRVGLASMVMLPLISSVVAPSAVMAASSSGELFGACDSFVCQSGLRCKACNESGGGSPCPSGLWCCSSTPIEVNTGGRTPGSSTFCVANQASCSFVGTMECCSGMATISSTTCSIPAGTFTCICD